MPALIPAILKGILFLFLLLLGLLLLVILLLLFVPICYRGNGAREAKQLSGDFSLSWLFSLLRLRLSYAAEQQMEFFVFGFRVYHLEEEEDKEKPEAPNVDRTDREEGATPAEVTEQTPEKTGTAEQRESVAPPTPAHSSSEEQRAMRGRSRSRAHRRQRIISDGLARLQTLLRNAETQCEFWQNDRTQRFLQFLKRKLFRFLRELLPRHMSGVLRFGFADPAMTGQGAALAAMFLPLYQDSLQIEPLFDCEELSGKLSLRGHIQLFVFLFGAAQLWFHPDFRFVYRHIRGKDRKQETEEVHG